MELFRRAYSQREFFILLMMVEIFHVVFVVFTTGALLYCYCINSCNPS